VDTRMTTTTMTVRERGTMWSYRSLIWNFAQRDLKARFKGTALGWLWSLVVPLATLLIYSLVFSTIFRATPPPFGNGRPGNFTVWLLAGLTAWSMFANSLNTAIGALLGAGPLLKKIYFPPYAPVLGSVAALLIQSAIELGILLVVLVAFANISWTWLLVPFWLAIFAVFLSSISVALAVLNVHFRDLAHIIGVAIQLLFYLSPIIYTMSFIPAGSWHGIPLRAVIAANPMTQFIEVFRDLTYGLTPGRPLAWAYIVAWTVAVALVARQVYRARGLDLSEEL
jgi:ABC-type polysaccharide/polyol phosphate export permease